MPAVARLGDKTKGRTTGEHHGHYINGSPVHGSGTLNGTISGGCSDFVFIDGKPCSVVGSTISETDNCGSGTGKTSQASSFVFIQSWYKGRITRAAIPRVGDATSPHNGSANIITGSPTVFIDK